MLINFRNASKAIKNGQTAIVQYYTQIFPGDQAILDKYHIRLSIASKRCPE